MLNRYPGPQLNLILPAARSQTPARAFNLPALARSPMALNSHRTAPPILKQPSEEIVSCQNPCALCVSSGIWWLPPRPTRRLIICHFVFLDFFFRTTYHPPITEPFCSTGESGERRGMRIMRWMRTSPWNECGLVRQLPSVHSPPRTQGLLHLHPAASAQRFRQGETDCDASAE
jgi:hypothetical protein